MLNNLLRELRLRLRQAVVISAGLGMVAGAGLLTTAGPASAAQAAASHPVVQVQKGRGCRVRVPARGGGGPVRARCCVPRPGRWPGRPITVKCCPAPVAVGHGRRTVRPGCCPGPVAVRHGGVVTLNCCPAPPPRPGWRRCKVQVMSGAVTRRCPGPPPARCKVHVKRGQGG